MVMIISVCKEHLLWVRACERFLGGSVVKNLPAKQEKQVQSLGWEDSLEKEIATHSGVLAWKMLWAEEPGGLYSMGS